MLRSEEPWRQVTLLLGSNRVFSFTLCYPSVWLHLLLPLSLSYLTYGVLDNGNFEIRYVYFIGKTDHDVRIYQNR